MSCGCSTPTPPAPTQPSNTCGSCRQTVYLRPYPTGCGCGKPKPQCSCHEPEVPLCVPCGAAEPTCAKPERAIRLHIPISSSIAGTCFPLAACECGDPEPALADLVARVRRRGQCRWLLEYPAWDLSDCGVEFRWDSQLYALPKGRYELRFIYQGVECGCAELHIAQKCPVSTGSYTALRVRQSSYPAAAPPGAHNVFDQIAGFSAKLCSAMDKFATQLPLCPEDVTRLCAISLCKPAQLEVFDGFNSELVTFSGCTAGAVIVTRGVPRYKFPKGSIVRFVYSPNNVLAMMTPC